MEDRRRVGLDGRQIMGGQVAEPQGRHERDHRGRGRLLASDLDAARVTSLTRLYRGWRTALSAGVRNAREPDLAHVDAMPASGSPRAPIVTVHDAASHAMAWLGSVTGAPVVPLGVDAFGQSGRIDELYDAFELSTGHVVTAGLAALSRGPAG